MSVEIIYKIPITYLKRDGKKMFADVTSNFYFSLKRICSMVNTY